jgi:hypothetical protein
MHPVRPRFATVWKDGCHERASFATSMADGSMRVRLVMSSRRIVQGSSERKGDLGDISGDLACTEEKGRGNER